MEEEGTPSCTTTVRRNPHRRARATSALKPPYITTTTPLSPHSTESLKVFLRIKPIVINTTLKKPFKHRAELYTNARPRNNNKNEIKLKAKRVSEACVAINDDFSVTLFPPKGLRDGKRAKTEVFEGFSHVFSSHSSQVQVYNKMVKPLVDDFLNGKSGSLVALGPSGSGKTHTVFGSPRDPGMVPLALNQIFSEDMINLNQSSRTFYLSMFEISERGKSERLCDLLQDGGDLCFQQSAIRGLQEVLISDIQQAECLIARGMLKRATAMTNSNSQSSRSQCVINIRTVENTIKEESDFQLNGAVLTIVDLAGAEREKKTGNQGARLVESNFINNTSMVFGLCLRSLLEHQKNPKRPLQKHYQSSLLTRYLREYLEGKKRMALILTVKSGEEDYVDSSLLLRQASPYTKIKFDNIEDSVNLLCTKRHKQQIQRLESSKRMKFSPEERLNDVRKGVADQLCEEDNSITPQVPVDQAVKTISLELSERVSLDENSIGSAKQERSYMIMQNFAKALWNVLKEYKTSLEVAGNEIENLTKILAGEKAKSSEIEKELKDLKNYLSCGKQITSAKDSSIDGSSELVGCQGQRYQVGENTSQAFREVLANEKAKSSEIQIETEALKEISADRSPEQVEYEEESCQVAETQSQHLTEVPVDENARSTELEINVSCWKENYQVKDDDIFIDNKNGEQVGNQQSKDIHDSDSCNGSTSLIVNSKSQGQLYQSTDQEYGESIEDVDCAEPLTELTEVVKHDSLFNVSEHENPLGSFPELITLAKESFLEPFMITKGKSFQSVENNQTSFDEYKDQVGGNQIQHFREIIADEHAKRSDLENSLSCCKENSAAKDYINDSNSYNNSSLAVVSFKSHGHGYPSSDQEYGVFLEDVNGSESVTKLTDVEKYVTQVKDSGHHKPLVSSPVLLTKDKECILEPLTELKDSTDKGIDNSQFGAAVSTHQKSLVSSLELATESSREQFTLNKENSCLSVESNQTRRKKYKGKQVKDQDFDVNNKSKIEKKSRPLKPSNVEKPKRRLAPASSILLKDLGGLTFDDENAKPKGSKGDKKSAPGERNITQGSLSLLRLLNNNVHL